MSLIDSAELDRRVQLALDALENYRYNRNYITGLKGGVMLSVKTEVTNKGGINFCLTISDRLNFEERSWDYIISGFFSPPLNVCKVFKFCEKIVGAVEHAFGNCDNKVKVAENLDLHNYMLDLGFTAQLHYNTYLKDYRVICKTMNLFSEYCRYYNFLGEGEVVGDNPHCILEVESRTVLSTSPDLEYLRKSAIRPIQRFLALSSLILEAVESTDDLVDIFRLQYLDNFQVYKNIINIPKHF